MRFLYAMFATLLWSWALAEYIAQGHNVSEEIAILSMAIIAAGGLAGKD